MKRSAFAFYPGQRFIEAADPTRDNSFIEVAWVDRDQHGTPRVAFRYTDGREVMIYAGQARAAIAAGLLVPSGAIERYAA